MTPLELSARGWPVFPITLRVEASGRVAKQPAIRAAHQAGCTCRGECGQLGHGHHDATADVDTIDRWAKVYPRCQWGVSTGPAGLVVVDVDRPKGPRPDRVLPDQGDDEVPDGIVDGEDVACWAAERRRGVWPPDTLMVRTVSGGLHAYFATPAGVRVTSGAGMTSGLGWCLDVRAWGGWVVAPGARCDAGAWEIEHDAPVAPLPAWVLLWLAAVGRVPTLERPPASAPTPRRPPEPSSRSPYVIAALTRELEAVASAQEGTRNVILNRASFSLGQLVDPYGLDLRAVADSLLAAAEAAGLRESEAKSAIRSGLAAGRRSPRGIGGVA